MQKQVDKSHYGFHSYMNKRRWASIWHQLDEVIAHSPSSVLEVGPGSGIFKNAARAFGLDVQTLDIDPELNPDHVAPATAIPMKDRAVDVSCAFQVLEHMPFETSMQALKEMCRVTGRAVIISLPDVKTSWPFTLTLPRLGTLRFVLPRPWFKPQPHDFNGEHYWEINKKNYSLAYITSEISANAPDFNLRTYRVHEHQYHRFFILERSH